MLTEQESSEEKAEALAALQLQIHSTELPNKWHNHPVFNCVCVCFE